MIEGTAEPIRWQLVAEPAVGRVVSMVHHMDYAHGQAEEVLAEFLEDREGDWGVLLVRDILGKLRVIVRCPKSGWQEAKEAIDTRLAQACGPYWSGQVLRCVGEKSPDFVADQGLGSS